MKVNEVVDRRILLSPLNWGLGHVTRCIGLIQLLQNQGNRFYVACDEHQQAVFENYLENVTYIRHLGYPFSFEGKGKFTRDLISNRKPLLARFAREQKEIDSYITEHQIAIVLSDHRYGFFSKQVYSLFLTHQIQLPLSMLFAPAQWIHRRLIGNFNAIWCFDDHQSSLAGKLSKNKASIPVEYIGWFSRYEARTSEELTFDALFIVSGPAPYSTQFLSEVFQYCETHDGTFACLVNEFNYRTQIPSNLKLVVASNWKHDDRLMYQSKCIVSRSGYSTLMDLKKTQKSAILIPTPGQSEQLYLATLHQTNPAWKIVKPGEKWDLPNFHTAARD